MWDAKEPIEYFISELDSFASLPLEKSPAGGMDRRDSSFPTSQRRKRWRCWSEES